MFREIKLKQKMCTSHLFLLRPQTHSELDVLLPISFPASFPFIFLISFFFVVRRGCTCWRDPSWSSTRRNPSQEFSRGPTSSSPTSQRRSVYSPLFAPMSRNMVHSIYPTIPSPPPLSPPVSANRTVLYHEINYDIVANCCGVVCCVVACGVLCWM